MWIWDIMGYITKNTSSGLGRKWRLPEMEVYCILNGTHESDKFEYPLGGFLWFFLGSHFLDTLKWHKLASSR